MTFITNLSTIFESKLFDLASSKIHQFDILMIKQHFRDIFTFILSQSDSLKTNDV